MLPRGALSRNSPCVRRAQSAGQDAAVTAWCWWKTMNGSRGMALQNKSIPARACCHGEMLAALQHCWLEGPGWHRCLGCCPAWREGKQLRYQVSRLAHFHLTHPGGTEPVWCHLGGLLHDRATNSPKQLVLTCHLLKNYKPSCCRQRNLFAALSSSRCSAHWRCCGHTVPSCSSVSPAEVSKVSWEEEQAPEACIKISILNFSPLLGLVREMLN